MKMPKIITPRRPVSWIDSTGTVAMIALDVNKESVDIKGGISRGGDSIGTTAIILTLFNLS
jgi:hypothetical protein